MFCVVCHDAAELESVHPRMNSEFISGCGIMSAHQGTDERHASTCPVHCAQVSSTTNT